MKVTLEFDSGESRWFELMDESGRLAGGEMWQVKFCDPVNGDEIIMASPVED